LDFCESMKASAIMHQFQSFFYPRVYEICRYCGIKITDHSLKNVRMCPKCVRVDTSSTFLICSSDEDSD
jgi:hypothetical protein